MRDKSEIQSHLEENEEDLADIMKKYKAVVQQQTVDQITMNDQLAQIEELIVERDKLKAEVRFIFCVINSLFSWPLYTLLSNIHCKVFIDKPEVMYYKIHIVVQSVLLLSCENVKQFHL